MNTKHLIGYSFFAAFSILAVAFPNAAAAFVIRTGDQVIVPKGETINETLLVAGQSVTIDGDVKGDVICAGQNIDINGLVEGDVICAGQNITVANAVSGSVRAAGQTLKINGAVGRNVTVAGQSISAGSTIAGEMFFAGQQAIINGRVEKNVAGAADSITINGQIAGNADFKDNKLALQDGGRIAGALNYASANELTGQSNQVLGGIKRTIPQEKDRFMAGKTQKSVEQKIGDKITDLAVNLALALALMFFFKDFTQKLSAALLEKPVRSLGWGFVILAIVPLIAAVLVLTIIGIPVAIIMVLLYLAALFLSRLFAAVAVGRKITQSYWKNKQESRFVHAVIGVIVLWVLFAIPVVGGILSFGAMVWGLGGLRYAFSKNKQNTSG